MGSTFDIRPVSLFLYAIIILLFISTVTLSVLLGVYVHKYNSVRHNPSPLPTPLPPSPPTSLPLVSSSPTSSPAPAGLQLSINSTWDDRPITHAPITFSFQWNEPAKAITLTYKAPLYNNPPAPNHTAGAVPMLYNYEVVEVFIANDKAQYLEMELGPHNQWLCLFLDGQRQAFNTGETLQLAVWNQLTETTWTGEVDIPLAYLPANVSSINAYNIHVENDVKIYEAASPAPTGKYKGPDFHRLQYFTPLDSSLIIPPSWMSQTHPYLDERYGDLWKGHY